MPQGRASSHGVPPRAADAGGGGGRGDGVLGTGVLQDNLEHAWWQLTRWRRRGTVAAGVLPGRQREGGALRSSLDAGLLNAAAFNAPLRCFLLSVAPRGDVVVVVIFFFSAGGRWRRRAEGVCVRACASVEVGASASEMFNIIHCSSLTGRGALRLPESPLSMTLLGRHALRQARDRARHRRLSGGPLKFD